MKSQLLTLGMTITIFMCIVVNSFAQEDRVFKLKTENGRLQPADGSPYMIAAYTPDGNTPSGIFADFRNTKFDLSEVSPEDKTKIAIAVQRIARKSTHTVLIDASKFESFYVDSDYTVFPPSSREIQDNGPFVRFLFKRDNPATDKFEPLDSWKITIKQKDRTLQGTLSSEGAFDILNVSVDQIHCTLKDPKTKKIYQYTAFPKIRSASKDLIVQYLIYSIREANNTEQ